MTDREADSPQRRAKLLSPPISPEGKLAAQKRRLDETEASSTQAKDSEWMEIKPQPAKKKQIMNFLGAYNLPQLKKNSTKSKPSKKSPPAPSSSSSSSSSSTPSDKSEESKKEEELNIEEASVDGSQKASKNSTENVASREYDTRSKKKTSPSTSTPSSLSSSASTSEANTDEVTDLKEKLVEAKNNGEKGEFLRLSTVSLIHDLPLEDIPNFEPKIELNDEEFLKIIKKLGLTYKLEDGETKETTIKNVLKLTDQQFIETNKRFFAEKARRTYNEQTFKKTDAQRACKIDVNKTSKLYEIYQACDALDDDLFRY
ncbi:hypothetical protein WICANDRAFT_80622 [Wickerhamomyces anomalus NRRL Y-366-8]|uniref:SWIRM domain-containing protein n=1 Tax=Wickerhamomyces anomalus (strain ATCC 58044 / CBS 1984 / NCYC 433 / NRRL Y-366-8) TaxID=683960 RepID=A0A1E3P0P8_WICAA|nr:uncharacterized protein WICANDRAFT_80622 [Wickerhamomyces anomalus NRRL Y-366-8]ODQ58487.1 hypothetical protein WICANDRAFT_80622 [Wickerhamomyces anomalus NRRL Y-366-8]